MTQDEIIRMATEVWGYADWKGAPLERLERFVALVAENTGIEQQREIVRLKGIIEEQANGAQNLVAAHEREKQAENEPIRFIWNGEGWIEADDYIWKTTDDYERRILYAAPVQQAEQEPVAWNDLDEDELAHKLGWRIGDPLYMTIVGIGQEAIHHFKAQNTAPVRTKDLTDEELNAMWYGNTKDGWLGLFRAVIAADRELNK